MFRKYILIIVIPLLITSCSSPKDSLIPQKPAVYKLVKQLSFYYHEKRISFWKEEWIKETKSIDSTHFVYRNFDTYYVFMPNKVYKKLELRNYADEDVLSHYQNEVGIIGKYTNNSIHTVDGKNTIKRKGLDTLIIEDNIQKIESVLVLIKNK